MRYFEDLPYLTKDIIRSEGEGLFARQLNTIKNFPSKTGGSTGLSCMIYYDQESLDYSAAVNLFTRERIGKYRWHEDIHFACRFPGEKDPKWPSVGDYKNFALNRSNIFFDRLDDQGLEEIWKTLKKRRPYLIHAHPSTIYALSFYVDKIQDKTKAFEIFESSGELLQPNMREKIQHVFKCKIFNRYGLAEFGVLGYQLDQNIESMMMLDSEGWPESRLDNMRNHELVFTGFRNRLMPLIKYRTGDYGEIEHTKNGFYLKNVIGRIHDIVPLNGSMYPTQHIMDILDHRIKGVQEFQIDVRATPPILRIVLETSVNLIEHQKKIEAYWPGIFQIQYVGFNDLVRVGSRQKFRHVVSS